MQKLTCPLPDLPPCPPTGLCPDWSDWKPEDALKNATEAMGLADDWLNVPQVCLKTRPSSVSGRLVYNVQSASGAGEVLHGNVESSIGSRITSRETHTASHSLL